jgi:chromosome segregation ATPase|tara:strand:+ start:2589 stop:3158 length:570 start_codon:yes stop_codon:yes gene_type:complete
MDIGKEIEEQQRSKKLQEDIRIGQEELGKIVDQITTKNRELGKLVTDKAKFLESREKEAIERVREADENIREVKEEIAVLGESLAKTIDNTEKTITNATEALRGLVSGAKELVKEADGLKTQYKSLIEFLQKKGKELDIHITKNSQWEKDLKEMKEEVDQKNKDADIKLKKAKDIAFWHKEPGAVYKEE